MERAEPVDVIARDILAGHRTLDDVLDHPMLLQVEDAVAQGAQGPLYDRTDEMLGRTDIGVSRLRRVFERELSAVASGGRYENVELRQPTRPLTRILNHQNF